MTLDDEDLRRLYRSYVAGRVGPDRKACPSWKELSGFFENRTRARQKLKIVDHVTGCAGCAEEFEFLRQLRLRGDQIAQEVERRRSLSPSGRIGIAFLWKYSPVAAGILLVAASLAIIIQKWSNPGMTRAAPSSVILIGPDQRHPVSLPLTFEWEEFRGADAYTLELFDEALLLVWKSQATALSRLNLPEEVVKRIPLNKRYFWLITAYKRGARLAESTLASFTLTSKNR